MLLPRKSGQVNLPGKRGTDAVERSDLIWPHERAIPTRRDTDPCRVVYFQTAPVPGSKVSFSPPDYRCYYPSTPFPLFPVPF
jgi:hypothetical protein